MSERFRTFASQLLEAHGALASPVEPMGLELLLPPGLQQTLELPEHGVLAFSSDVPDGWRRVVLESDWLDRLGGLLANQGQQTRLRLPAPSVVAPAHPERILAHHLRLGNAVYRLQGVEESWTRCLLHTFRYTAVSDEKRDGLVQIGRNLGSGGILDPWVELLSRTARASHDQGEEEIPCPESHATEAWGRLTRHLLPLLVRRQLHPFLAGMQRRQQRDLDRLHGYHGDLRQEVFTRLVAARRKGEDKLVEERQRASQRLASISREYQAKALDLRDKYALTIRIERVQSLLLEARVFRFRLLVKRRKGERACHLDWHPILRQLEEPPCEAGLPFGNERLVCDEALHWVSPEGMAACTGCDKPFCRACHPAACPRCHRRWLEMG